ncbi:Fic family protein [Maricaulaceae bacterium MS644]
MEPLSAAGRALARFDGALGALPNPDLLLGPLTANEAVLSSRIEGTQATLDEVLEAEAGASPAPNRRNDIVEVRNYRAAVAVGAALVEERGIALSLIRELHQRLMTGARGGERFPGRFRTEQNWIGRAGSPIEQARFVPPNPVLMVDGNENLAAYLNEHEDDPLLATAVAHAQFEIIHPFLDGNGRVGRMLIPLMLAFRGAITSPTFYISQYLEERRSEYYDRLLGVTEAGDWDGWVRFFCGAVEVQAQTNLSRVRALQKLEVEMRLRFAEVTGSRHASTAVDAFFKRPAMTGPEFTRALELDNRATAGNMLRQLEDAGLIECLQRGSGRRPSRYMMRRIVRVAEGAET